MADSVKPKEDPSKTTKPESTERIPGRNGYFVGSPAGNGPPKWRFYETQPNATDTAASREPTATTGPSR